MKTEEQVVKALTRKGYTIVTAESCTGGLVAGTIVNVPGSSSCFHEGYITYSNEAKQRLLGVKEESLTEYGAVSKEVVREMAEGAIIKSGADVAVSVSGIAGPDGGSKEKPVGTVYVGLSVKKENNQIQTETVKLFLKGNREEIRKRTVEEVLKMVLNAILLT